MDRAQLSVATQLPTLSPASTHSLSKPEAIKIGLDRNSDLFINSILTLGCPKKLHSPLQEGQSRAQQVMKNDDKTYDTNPPSQEI